MRQQATAEFAKMGLPQGEIDGLLDKMGDAVVAVAADAMRQDFARAFTEVYTKDELRGMADFYDTAAGKAWAEKQPEVQQKLMQAMDAARSCRNAGRAENRRRLPPPRTAPQFRSRPATRGETLCALWRLL